MQNRYLYCRVSEKSRGDQWSDWWCQAGLIRPVLLVLKLFLIRFGTSFSAVNSKTASSILCRLFPILFRFIRDTANLLFWQQKFLFRQTASQILFKETADWNLQNIGKIFQFIICNQSFAVFDFTDRLLCQIQSVQLQFCSDSWDKLRFFLIFFSLSPQMLCFSSILIFFKIIPHVLL